MKINDILSEKDISEGPAGGLGQMANKLGGKLLNKVPGAAAKSKAANMLGKADLGDTANNLHKEFNQYLGRNAKKMAQATGEDYAEFLKFKKHKTSAAIPSGVLQKTQLDQLLNTASKEALNGKGGVGPSDTTPGATKAAPAGKQSAAAPGAAKGPGPGKVSIPPNILSQIQKMNPTEKKQLAGMLK